MKKSKYFKTKPLSKAEIAFMKLKKSLPKPTLESLSDQVKVNVGREQMGLPKIDFDRS